MQFEKNPYTKNIISECIKKSFLKIFKTKKLQQQYISKIKTAGESPEIWT